MTFTDKNNNKPKSLLFRKKSENINLIIHGQGVFLFENTDGKSSTFNLYNEDKTDGINVQFNINSIIAYQISSGKVFFDVNNDTGLLNKNGIFYWFSFDSQNEVLQGGIGEARLENSKYVYVFSEHNDKSFLESLVQIEISSNINPLKLLRDPITSDISLLIKNTNELSMDDIASNAYLPKSSLTTVAQKLYDCISGENFVLDDDNFPDFSKAIEYSIKTPGCWCYEKLKSKSTEFNPDKPNILETYLRITLGSNSGESPGVPYVMEIWPVGHFSPVHNHSEANAIIRVLHGSINVSLFPFLCLEPEGIEPFAKVNFNKDEITWISPTLNQTHQLKNLEENVDTCVTIQCYMYDAEDKVHYDYFDYIDDNGKKQQYEPDSDMDFVEFKELMKKEWDMHIKSDNYTILSLILNLRKIFTIYK